MEENQCIRISVPPTSLLDGGGTRQSDQIAPPTHSQLQTLAEAASLPSINPTITACPHEAHSSLPSTTSTGVRIQQHPLACEGTHGSSPHSCTTNTLTAPPNAVIGHPHSRQSFGIADDTYVSIQNVCGNLKKMLIRM